MPGKKLSRKARCPCGNGKTYKNCCWAKVLDDRRTGRRSAFLSGQRG